MLYKIDEVKMTRNDKSTKPQHKWYLRRGEKNFWFMFIQKLIFTAGFCNCVNYLKTYWGFYKKYDDEGAKKQ